MERISSSGEQLGKPENGSPAPRSSIERDLNALIGAVALLGLKRCSQCGQFYRGADSGALFDGGELVCYGCVAAWWSAQSPELSAVDRQKLETKLASWLRKHHQAQVLKDPAKLPAPDQCLVKLATSCVECGGSGKLLEGERCRFCDGQGTVFVVVLKPVGQATATKA
jgi:hypothetical protein